MKTSKDTNKKTVNNWGTGNKDFQVTEEQQKAVKLFDELCVALLFQGEQQDKQSIQ